MIGARKERSHSNYVANLVGGEGLAPNFLAKSLYFFKLDINCSHKGKAPFKKKKVVFKKKKVDFLNSTSTIENRERASRV